MTSEKNVFTKITTIYSQFKYHSSERFKSFLSLFSDYTQKLESSYSVISVRAFIIPIKKLFWGFNIVSNRIKKWGLNRYKYGIVVKNISSLDYKLFTRGIRIA